MPRSDLVQSTLRSLNILDVVGQSERGLSLHDICEMLGLKQSTVYNLLRTLVARNYIMRTPAPIRYRLGGAVFRLADEAARHDLVMRAGGVLRQLRTDLVAELQGELAPDDDIAVAFAQALGGEIRLLLRIRSDRPGVLTRPMSLMHPYRSMSSLVYQAYWTREERAAYRRAHPFEEQGIPFWKHENEMKMFLQQVRVQQCALSPISPDHVLQLSVPVFDKGDALVGALGVEVWKRLNKLTKFRLTRITTDAAKQLSAKTRSESK